MSGFYSTLASLLAESSWLVMSCTMVSLVCPARDAPAARQRTEAMPGPERTGATGTPAFHIEGGLLPGAYPMPIFRQILDSIYAVKTGG